MRHKNAVCKCVAPLELTVCNYAHIGNLRTYIFEDILRRVLEFNDYTVQHVMNITDVGHLTSDADTGEDKMEKGSRRTGKTAWEIAELYTQAFKDDLLRLKIRFLHPLFIFMRCSLLKNNKLIFEKVSNSLIDEDL